MGQNASCLRSATQEDAFLENEMRIYRWRADPRSNAFLPRVSFAPPSAASRQRFASFLQHSPQDYLRMEDFKPQPNSNAGQLLVFEKYACTLEQVEGILGAAEAAYALTALAAAFAGLLAEFQEVVVARHCWFVTKSGHVRAWINHDPRCNFIDSSSTEQLFTADNCRGVAFKILSEVLKCCEQSQAILSLFSFVRQGIEKQGEATSEELFEFMRERISYYSGKTNLPVCISIEATLRKQRQRSTSINRSNAPMVIACRPQASKALNETRMTGCTVDNERSFHCKSKSLELGHSQFIKTMPVSSLLEPSPSSLFTHTSSHWQPSSIFTNIINNQPIPEGKKVKLSRFIESKDSELASVKASQVIQSGSRVVKLSESLERTEKPKPIIKISDSNISKQKCVPIQLQTSQHSKNNTPTDSLKISLDNDILISQNVLTEEDANLQLIDQKQIKHEHRASKFSKNSRGRPIERKVSILEFDEGEKDGARYLHAHTYHEVNSNSLLEQERMPWRTNKTITRLINDDTDSLVHSIGSSSEDNPAGSLYSGVLTHMGRDITRKDIDSIHSHNSQHTE